MLVVVNALHNNPVTGDGMNLLVNLKLYVAAEQGRCAATAAYTAPAG
jgi:hypothetical protein